MNKRIEFLWRYGVPTPQRSVPVVVAEVPTTVKLSTIKRVWIGSGDSGFPREQYDNPQVAQSHTVGGA